ncbi:hypothetical protein L484_014858 [Morus notabilis]|uniref:Uncharacterized protein n=1 Tax=Morus notabilis TaxID=981085 RepID=W9SCK8_9ROSA|nr:hypothetical protein L484_014858 [Morus notabilis]
MRFYFLYLRLCFRAHGDTDLIEHLQRKLGARRFRGSQEGKKTHPLLHLARDDNERASSIDEQRIEGAKHGRCRTLEWQRKTRSYLFFQACSDIWFPWKIKLVSRVMGNLPAQFGEH